MNGITSVFGSLSTYGLGHIELHSYQVLSPLSPPPSLPSPHQTLTYWQIIFLYCGGITLIFSIISILFFPDSPMEARFWRYNERDIAIERLRANQMGIVSRKWKKEHVTEAVLDLKTWYWFFLVMAIS